MKINAETSYLHTSQRAQTSAADRNGAASFSAALASATSSTTKAEAAGVKQPDFTSMTRQEMRDWVNGQIRSGEMSLDDGRPFIAMTMKIPVNGGYGGDLPTAGDSERFDFTQKARDGIEGALSRNDGVTLKMLESAMAIMQRQ